MEYSVQEAKTHLSKLLAQAEAGETVVITKGRDKKPVIRLVPVTSGRIGFMKGLLPDDLGDQFLEPMPDEEIALWYDGPIEPTK